MTRIVILELLYVILCYLALSGRLCWSTFLLPPCPCWMQLMHLA